MTFLSSLRLRPRHAKPRPMFRPCLESLEARLVLTVPILSPAYPIAPSWATAGAPAKPIEVEGSNFVATSTVDFNGAPLTTAFISTNELVATIPASDLTTVRRQRHHGREPRSGRWYLVAIAFHRHRRASVNTDAPVQRRK